MKIADGIEMLELTAQVAGRVETIHPVLIWDEEAAVLADAGFPGQWPLLREAIRKAGVPVRKLSAVIVTHQDIDHIGGLPALLAEAERKVEVLADEREKPYIQGERMLLRITPEAVDRAVRSLPPEVPEPMRRSFRAALENPPKAPVDATLADGQILPWCGGIVVIHTPGHTPGHLCLYHRRSKTLIAADAMTVEGGRLTGPDPATALDPAEARRSLRKLTPFDIEAVVCYHGGLYRGDASRRIAELASEA
jgi:glyoxylase-like metal-dependent hydrolase (beta-lactamase superfamily II)